MKSFSRVRLPATHGLQPTRLLHPWDFPGNSTGVGVPLPSPQQKSRYFLILQQISIAQRKRFISRLIGNVDFSSFQVNNLEILHTPSNTTQPVPSINRFWYNESESEVPQSYPTLQPHGLWPTRLLRPWDSPGKSTGVGCHFLLQCVKVKSESEVAQSCPTLCDPMDYSLPGSSIHGIFQPRVLEWGAISFSVIL